MENGVFAIDVTLIRRRMAWQTRPPHRRARGRIREALPPDEGAESDLQDGLGWDGTVRAMVKGKDDFTVHRER